MLTLHKVAKTSRKIIFGLVIAFVLLIFGSILFPTIVTIKERYLPTPKPPPTVAFGKLPPITFPKSTQEKKFTYRLETLTGKLPTFEDRVEVFKVTFPQAGLLSLERAKSRVSRIGFTTPPIAFSDTFYLWNEDEPPYRKLILDVGSYRFTLSSNFAANEDVLKARYLPTEKEAVEVASSFLTSLAQPSDLDEAKTKTTLLSVKNAELVPAAKRDTAQIVRVDFFQKDVSKLPLYYTNYPHSTLFVLMGSGKDTPQVVQANFSYNKATKTSATYNIISADQAFGLLKEGKAHIASYQGTASEVVLRKVSLGYFVEEKKQDFLMPIIVFEGDDNFVAFVQAITDAWIRR